MNNNALPKTITPQEAAQVFRVGKNTIYQWIGSGELIAKKIGKTYRIPQSEIAFAQTGLDFDLYLAEQEDLKSINKVREVLKSARASN